MEKHQGCWGPHKNSWCWNLANQLIYTIHIHIYTCIWTPSTEIREIRPHQLSPAFFWTVSFFHLGNGLNRKCIFLKPKTAPSSRSPPLASILEGSQKQNHFPQTATATEDCSSRKKAAQGPTYHRLVSGRWMGRQQCTTGVVCFFFSDLVPNPNI